MEEFFLKLAALMEEFYFLFMIFALAVATNAAANLVKAINSARHTEDQPEKRPPALPQALDDSETVQEQLRRIEKLLSAAKKESM